MREESGRRREREEKEIYIETEGIIKIMKDNRSKKRHKERKKSTAIFYHS